MEQSLFQGIFQENVAQQFLKMLASAFTDLQINLVLFLFVQAGFDPHPHMRAPGLPASLTSISGGKPYVLSFCFVF